MEKVLFKKKKRRKYKTYSSWGDRISIEKWAEKEGDLVSVNGHKTPRPNKGDLLFVPMQSGKNVVLEFVELNYCFDPPDMFFAECKILDYEEELDIKNIDK